MAAVFINGQPVAPAQLALAQDRGLLLGESVFATLLVKNNVPQFWDAHIKRLHAACDFYGLHLPANIVPNGDMQAALKHWARALLAENTMDEPQVLRLTISGGAVGAGWCRNKRRMRCALSAWHRAAAIAAIKTLCQRLWRAGRSARCRVQNRQLFAQYTSAQTGFGKWCQ